jgi:hypothetical protein
MIFPYELNIETQTMDKSTNVAAVFDTLIDALEVAKLPILTVRLSALHIPARE